MVAERHRRLSAEPPQHLACRVSTFRDRRPGDLGEQRAVAAGRGGEVSRDEHLGMARHRQVGVDDDATAPALQMYGL